jgi:phosphotriesterase-related protein
MLENVRILKDAGADLSHVIVGHVCMHDFDTPTCHKLMDAGCYIGIDMFGLEGIHFLPHEKIYMEMNDQKRIKKIIDLINDGYIDHILLSQDVATKERLVSYGGFGYGHILRDILPVLRNKGLSDEQINTMLRENPKQAVAFTPAKD